MFLTPPMSDCGLLILDNPDKYTDLFEIREQHRCTKLIHSNDRIQGAVIDNLMEWKTLVVQAKRYIICAGTDTADELNIRVFERSQF